LIGLWTLWGRAQQLLRNEPIDIAGWIQANKVCVIDWSAAEVECEPSINELHVAETLLKLGGGALIRTGVNAPFVEKRASTWCASRSGTETTSRGLATRHFFRMMIARTMTRCCHPGSSALWCLTIGRDPPCR
jgi:hypothetical protein